MKKAILACSVLSILIVVLFVGCGHTHEYTEATCTEPKTCTTCGETEGEALGHSFVEATCTEPKTCTICGEAEGEPLGHLVEIGRCERCDEIQYATEFAKIMIYTKMPSGFIKNGYEDLVVLAKNGITNSTLIYNALKKLEEANSESKNVLYDALVLCGDYSELEEIKLQISNVLNSEPEPIFFTDSDSIQTALSEWQNYLLELICLDQTVQKAKNELF